MADMGEKVILLDEVYSIFGPQPRGTGRVENLIDGLEAERIGARVRPIRARPWPERPVSAANKSRNDVAATRSALTHLRALFERQALM